MSYNEMELPHDWQKLFWRMVEIADCGSLEKNFATLLNEFLEGPDMAQDFMRQKDFIFSAHQQGIELKRAAVSAWLTEKYPPQSEQMRGILNVIETHMTDDDFEKYKSALLLAYVCAFIEHKAKRFFAEMLDVFNELL